MALALTAPAWGQATYNWNAANSGGTGGNGTAWIRVAASGVGVNWINGAAGKMPGVDNNTSTTIDGNANDVGVFNQSANTSIDLGMSNSTSNGVTANGAANGFLSVGAITTVTGTGQVTIRASSVAPTPPGILQLNGAYAGNTAGLAANTLVSATSANFVFNRDNNGNLLDVRLGIDGGLFTAAAGRAISFNLNVGEAAGGPKGFTKDGAGRLTFTGQNTYTGVTNIAAGELMLTTTGKIDFTSAITVGSGASFSVSGVTGGYTLAASAPQTLQGLGSVTGAVTVAPGGTIRAGTGTGVGTLTTDNSVTLTGDATSGAQLRAAVNRTGTNTAEAGLLDVTGTSSVLNLGAGGSKFRIDLLNGATAPAAGETYTVTLASVATAGNIQLNGASQAANTTIANTAFDLTTEFGVTAGYVLRVDASGRNLVFEFTPVPEPVTVLAVGATALGLGGFLRRRFRNPA